MESVVLLLHQQAPKWGQQHQIDNLYETELFRTNKDGLPGQLASFVAAGGKLNQLAKAAVDVFIQRATGFGEVGPETKQALTSQLNKELARVLQKYRGGNL